MISGVRASSMRMLSTSSTIANERSRWTRLLELVDHVVAQVVEAELVVGAVGDVGRVRLGAGHRPEVDEALVGRREARLEQVARVVGDDADRQPEEVVDRPHPLRVAAGEVVVDGDEVRATAGQAVEREGQRRDEGLALARLHLGDLPLVEDHAADELDVEVAHPERPLARLTGRREDLGDDVVEGPVDRLVLALAARLARSERRSLSAWLSSSSDGSSPSATSWISALTTSIRSRISVSDRAANSSSSSLISSIRGWTRLTSRSLVSRNRRRIAWPGEYRVLGRGAPFSGPTRASAQPRTAHLHRSDYSRHGPDDEVLLVSP